MAEIKRRRVTYKLYPTEEERIALEQTLELHCAIYNWTREHLIKADKKNKKLSYTDLCRLWTPYKKKHPKFKKVNAQSSQETIQRACISFETFRVKRSKGEAKGYPRTKKPHRIKGWGYKTHGDGNRVFSEGKHGSVNLSNIGVIPMRGEARTTGAISTVGVMVKNSDWFLSVVHECGPQRTPGTQQKGFDAGLMTYATIANGDGTYEEIENPRYHNKIKAELKKAQKDLSRKKKGSKNWIKQKEKLGKLYTKLENQHQNFTHQVSAALVKESSLIATEDLDITKMMAHGGAYKKGLNKSIADASWGKLMIKLGYKAEEAGIPFHIIPTQTVKPSQTCPQCGTQKKKHLSERTHSCDCGLTLSRDQAAARVILNWALFKSPYRPGTDLVLREGSSLSVEARNSRHSY